MADHQLGELQFHIFKETLGVQHVKAREHLLFLVDSPVTTTDVWEGQSKQRDWEENDMAFLPAGTDLHSSYVSREYNETIIRVPESTLVGAAWGNFNLADLDIRYHRVPRENRYGISEALRGMALAKQRYQGFDMVVESMTNTLAVTILSGLLRDSGRQLESIANGLSRRRRERVLEFIEANLANSITLSAIAEIAALSPYHFSRSFTRELGVSPIRYVWHRRMMLARQMLRDPRLPIAQVALACGFASQSHFTTAFKADTGATPAAYRKRME